MRISWLMLATKALLARFAWSAASLAALELGLGLLLRGDIDHEAQTAVGASPQDGQAVEHVNAGGHPCRSILFPTGHSRPSPSAGRTPPVERPVFRAR